MEGRKRKTRERRDGRRALNGTKEGRGDANAGRQRHRPSFSKPKSKGTPIERHMARDPVVKEEQGRAED